MKKVNWNQQANQFENSARKKVRLTFSLSGLSVRQGNRNSGSVVIV